MEPELQQQFNEEMRALLEKYEVELGIEDIPATKKIVIVPKKKEEVKE